MPTFHEFAERWWQENEQGWSQRTIADYRWRLERHLIPAFGELPLDRITIDAVMAYKADKLDGSLGARSVNMTLTTLAAILDEAMDRELIARNPAKGKRRRVRERRKPRSYLESSEQIEVMLEAATRLDREAPPGADHLERRAVVATFLFAGLRIAELVELRWRDVDLAGGWLRVRGTKTDNAKRHVAIRGALRDELTTAKARARFTAPDDPVFPTRNGREQSTNNVRSRVVRRTADLARQIAADRGCEFPARITPHSLRRTFASVAFAIGEDHAVIMREMGHTTPAFTLEVYAQAMARGEDERDRLRRLMSGGFGTELAYEPISAGAPTA